FQTFAPEPVPVGKLVPPHKALRFARARDTVGVAIKPVVAIRDDGVILMTGLGVRNAAGTSSALERHFVAVYRVVASLVEWAVVAPALVNQHDPAYSCGAYECVARHLNVLRSRKKDLGTPEPASLFAVVVPKDIVPDEDRKS